MSGKRYSTEEIISKLRETEVLPAQGVGVGEVVRRLGVKLLWLSVVEFGMKQHSHPSIRLLMNINHHFVCQR